MWTSSNDGLVSTTIVGDGAGGRADVGASDVDATGVGDATAGGAMGFDATAGATELGAGGATCLGGAVGFATGFGGAAGFAGFAGSIGATSMTVGRGGALGSPAFFRTARADTVPAASRLAISGSGKGPMGSDPGSTTKYLSCSLIARPHRAPSMPDATPRNSCEPAYTAAGALYSLPRCTASLVSAPS